MPQFAVIDIGTHSALLLIADVAGGQVTPVLDEACTTHLGLGLKETGRITAAAQARLKIVLARYEAIVSEYDVERVICYATAAFRYAENALACQQQIQAALGWTVQILSGEEEAHYTFQGALQRIRSAGAGDQDAIAIDIGGGSTEVIWGNASTLHRWWSLPIGALLLHEQFALTEQLSPAIAQAIDESLDEQFQVIALPTPAHVLVTGGTATTLAALLLDLTRYDITKIDGCAIAYPQIESVYEELNRLTLAQRADLPGMEAGRAAIILPAIRILLRLLARLRVDTITVTVRGARYGILDQKGRN